MRYLSTLLLLATALNVHSAGVLPYVLTTNGVSTSQTLVNATNSGTTTFNPSGSQITINPNGSIQGTYISIAADGSWNMSGDGFLGFNFQVNGDGKITAGSIDGVNVAGPIGTTAIVKLSAGTNKVSTASFASNNLPVLTYISDDGTAPSGPLILKPSEFSNGSFFTIRSPNSADTNRVQWKIIP